MIKLIVLISLLFQASAIYAHSEKHEHKHEEHKHEDHHDHDHHNESLGAHVHGESSLYIANDSKELLIEWKAPGESVLGFETKPQSKEQKKTWATIKDDWENSHSKFFSLPKAQCKIHHATISLKHSDNSEGASHSHIEAQAHLKCEKNLVNQELELFFSEKFPKIKKLTIEVLPGEGPPYKKVFKNDEKSTSIKI